MDNKKIRTRFSKLVKDGDQLIKEIPRDQFGIVEFIIDENTQKYQKWISSVANLLNVIYLHDSYYVEECERLITDKTLKSALTSYIVQRMFGLLEAAHEDWKSGFANKLEFTIAAATFDDFLDHAEQYHKSNKKKESAVLGSAVLEDTIKKIASKSNISAAGQSLEELINALVKKGVFTPVKSKRVKVWASVRNHTFHAEWDKFDIRDVGELIKGLRELIEDFL